MKRCSKCRQLKPLTAFYAMASGPYGKRPECIDCSKVSSGAYRRALEELKSRHPGEFAAILRQQRAVS